MPVHVATGNALDVVYDYENGHQVLKGLQRHEVLRVVLNEIRVRENNNA
jgi:hypothetical protein